MSRSEKEIQALLDSTKTQLRLESSSGVVTAQAEAREAYEALLTASRPAIETILDQGGFLRGDANVTAIMNALRSRRLVPSTPNIRNVMPTTGLIPKPAPTEAEIRAQLGAELKAEGASSTLIAKFQDMTVDQLQAKLQELRNVTRWKSMSHSELQAAAKAETASVPSGVTPVAPGTPILSPSISRHALTQYTVEEMQKLKRVMDQRHGVGAGDVAVSARLSGADADEIKRLFSI